MVDSVGNLGDERVDKDTMKQLMTDENARQCYRTVSLRFVIFRLGRLFFFIFGKLASISQPIRLKTKIWRKLAKHDFARFSSTFCF